MASDWVGQRVRLAREADAAPETALVKSVREANGATLCSVRFEADGYLKVDVPADSLERLALGEDAPDADVIARPFQDDSAYDAELDDEEMRSFDSINYWWRHLFWRETANHADYPFFDELPHGYELERAPTKSSSGN